MLRRNNTPEIAELLRTEPGRSDEMVVEQGRWRLDGSRVPLTLADWRDHRRDNRITPLQHAVSALFEGSVVNPSEARPALHPALRADDPGAHCPDDQADVIASARCRLLETAERLHAGCTPIRTLLHVGIGGSDLGPRLVADALDAGDGAVSVEWLTTLNARRLRRLFQRLDPGSTGLVIASKSFTTVETLTQARAIRDWLGPAWSQRAWAATAQRQRALDFGVDDEHVLEFPAGIGGRFSLWSGVGLSAAALVGSRRWRGLLAGARDADRAVERALADTTALGLAVCVDALVRKFGFDTLGVVAYEPRLRLLADYLQQLVMESLGKSVDVDGQAVDGPTSPLIFGGAGTDLQHSLFQALHQGSARHPMLLVGSAEPEAGFEHWQHEQLAHLLGQASALVNGRRCDESHKALPGSNPVVLMLSQALTPESLGELLAVFEHAVYLLGTSWRINPFDQWGVEEGKRLAGAFTEALRDGTEGPDPALAATIRWLRGEG